MSRFRSIQDIPLKDKRVFVRVDFNVPLIREGSDYKVSDSSRIDEALPTIRYLIEQGARCILASHLGRPSGKVKNDLSLLPVGSYLSEVLGKEVLFPENCVGDAVQGLSRAMRAGDLMLLENLRFHADEELNSSEFARQLSFFSDVYVSDAFGTLHRAHASTDALPRMINDKCIGFLVEKELRFLGPLRNSPKKPFYRVIGGAKISDKMGLLETFLPKVDKIIIGGGMAYAFLKVRGANIGKSLCSDSQVELAKKIITLAETTKKHLFLPMDHIVSESLEGRNVKTTTGESIDSGFMGVDIGPKTIAYFESALDGASTIFWNGPMGVFENEKFANGTYEMARMIAKSNGLKLAGGGDSALAILNSGRHDRFDFISTGGGATLEYLEGRELPGLKALEV